MKHAKHTPGPWAVDDVYGLIMANNGAYEVAAVHAARNDGEAKANARLIAAAPEMLEALNETLRHMDHSGDCAKHDPDPTYDSDGHIRMGRMPCPVCMVERAVRKTMGGAK